MDYDTGFLDAIGPEFEATAFVRHTWFGVPMAPSDTLILSLEHISRFGSTVWPELSIQFSHVTPTLNISYDDGSGDDSFASWMYGFEGNAG